MNFTDNSFFLLACIFWISFSVLVYSYILYPIILYIWTKIRIDKNADTDSGSDTSHDIFPFTSVIISAYNEEMVLDDKIKNLKSLDYPKDRIEILIGSDGSTDRTNEILLSAKDEKFVPLLYEERRGKSAVLNDLVKIAKGTIIVFSDANTLYHLHTIKKLVHHFTNPTVGAVIGELLLKYDKVTLGTYGEASYWTLENSIKKMESDIRTTLGATGPVYAIKKNLYTPLPITKIVMDDFVIPMNVIKQKFNVKYDPEAVAYEITSDSVYREFKRKVRIGAANFHGISEFREILMPQYGFAAFALWSHKMLRWLIPFLLPLILLSSMILANTSSFYSIVFLIEICIIGISVLGFFAERINFHIGLLGLPYYFLAMNTAILFGFFKFIFNKQKQTWEIVRHS